MAMKIASDGEGATRLVQCTVNGASSEENARALAKQVISSSLVKAAMFGCDANFGRFLCAMGLLCLCCAACILTTNLYFFFAGLAVFFVVLVAPFIG